MSTEEEAASTMTRLARASIIDDITNLVSAEDRTLDTEEQRERNERVQRILDANPEEIIIGTKLAAYEGTEEDTGDHIWSMEDGSYLHLPTEELYNHMCNDTKILEITHMITHQTCGILGTVL